MAEKVRVRFAPSPTGDLHLGNVRTALYNWLYARHTGGTFILRIEDTDKERSTEASVEGLLDILKWLGLQWDEGPQVGGPHASYRQSERTPIYVEHLERLKAGGHLYPCFCTEEELELERKRQLGRGQMPRYGGKCRGLSPSEGESLIASGKPFVMRFKAATVPVTVKDIVRGEVVFPADQIGDFVLTRSDGSPTYNFTVVVDDHLMGITHVLRGEDHLSNTPKQQMLYEALGWQPPAFAHLSILKGADGQKLSKRHGETACEHYREAGYLPAAFLNYLALLGWAPPDKEILGLEEMAKVFELERVGKSGAIFDPVKLRWMGAQYLAHVPLEELTRSVLPYLQKSGALDRSDARDRFDWLSQLVDTVRTHMACLSDIVPETRYFFTDELSFEPAQTEEMRTQAPLLQALESALEAETGEWTGQTFNAAVKAAGAKTGCKGKSLYHPIRLALTGRENGPELVRIVPLLGRDHVLARLKVWTHPGST
jgi:nondiscriminating glutamyl-tRNA synthetase